MATPQINFILDFEITAFFFGLILCLYLRLVGGVKTGHNKDFFRFAVMVTLGCAIDVISGATRYMPISNALHMLFTISDQCMGTTVPFLYMVYVVHLAQVDETGRAKPLALVHKVILAIFFVLQFINLFTGIGSTFNAEGRYVAGPLSTFLAYLYPIYFMVAGTLYLLIHRNWYSKIQRNAVIIAFLVTILLYAWQIAFARGVLIVFFVGCVDCYILYFSMETPAYQQLEVYAGELRNATSVAEAAEDEAVRADIAKGRFLANMSHEIRTPMTTILGMDELILKRNPEGLVHEYAKDIASAGDTLVHIINDILDFSKIESGEMTLEREPYHFGAVLREVDNMIRIKADQARLSYESHCPDDLVEELCGDALRMTQILINLLNNAVKYTREGSVNLTIGGMPEIGEHGRRVQRLFITVQDTGIGIREEDLGRLFQSYARVDRDVNRSVEGTGLGLAITARLIELMNGTIRVESEYGKGSTFYVELIQEIAGKGTIADYNCGMQKTSEGRSGVGFTAPDARVLIVDDNRMNRVVLKALLKDTGMLIDEAPDGDVAAMLAAVTRFDVILMDYMMPQPDGIATLKMIREDEHSASRDVPVVVCTADAITGERERLLAEGFDDYISKPVKGEVLRDVMLRFLPKEKIRDEEVNA